MRCNVKAESKGNLVAVAVNRAEVQWVIAEVGDSVSETSEANAYQRLQHRSSVGNTEVKNVETSAGGLRVN